jgi:hypothetical protein
LLEEATREKAREAMTALQVTASGVAVSMSKDGKTAYERTAKALKDAATD